jgi:cation diffusion facilitator family transporter
VDTHAHSGDHTQHSHTHGVVDPSIASTHRGIWAVKWSLAILIVTALLQVVVVALTGSVALLADTIHNFADASTSIPLWIAFALGLRKPSRRFTYGLGRVEDLAGMAIVLIILFSAVVAAYEAVSRLIHPQPISHIGWVAVAALIGFAGNEAVAHFRIRVGKSIGSAALVADGYHARVDGLTSLAVLAGAIGVWAGYPKADPIIGLLISLAIFRIVWESSKTVLQRVLDGIEPDYLDEIRHIAQHVEGVHEVSEIRARWVGHRLHAEINITVDPHITVAQGHAIAVQAHRQLTYRLTYLSSVIIHVDPVGISGESHHLSRAEEQRTEHRHAGTLGSV